MLRRIERKAGSIGLPKFVRFAVNVWKIPAEGITEEELAKAGVEALADFIHEEILEILLGLRGEYEQHLENIHAGHY